MISTKMSSTRLISATNRKTTRFGEKNKYSEGLYEIGKEIYAWLVPNGSWGESNTGLIVGDGESVLVDTLWDVDYTLEMIDAMYTITRSAPIQRIVNTHADGDHFWGNQLFPFTEIISSQETYLEMKKVRPLSMLLLQMTGRLLSFIKLFGAIKAGNYFQQMAAPYAFENVTPTLPNKTFEGELTIHTGGRDVKLFQVGPAHTLGDSCVYIPDAKVLFAGDVLFVGVTPVAWSGPIENCISALNHILDMDVDIIVPGHGPIIGKDDIHHVKAYWEYINQQTHRCYDQKMTAREAAYEIVFGNDFSNYPFSQWNTPERIMTNVHTIYRHLQNKTDAYKIHEMLALMYKQAVLAHALPNAQPLVMHNL